MNNVNFHCPKQHNSTCKVLEFYIFLIFLIAILCNSFKFVLNTFEFILIKLFKNWAKYGPFGIQYFMFQGSGSQQVLTLHAISHILVCAQTSRQESKFRNFRHTHFFKTLNFDFLSSTVKEFSDNGPGHFLIAKDQCLHRWH